MTRNRLNVGIGGMEMKQVEVSSLLSVSRLEGCRTRGEGSKTAREKVAKVDECVPNARFLCYSLCSRPSDPSPPSDSPIEALRVA